MPLIYEYFALRVLNRDLSSSPRGERPCCLMTKELTASRASTMIVALKLAKAQKQGVLVFSVESFSRGFIRLDELIGDHSVIRKRDQSL